MQLQAAVRITLVTLAIGIALSIGAVSKAHAATIFASNFNSNTITAYDFVTGAFLGTPVSAGPESNGFTGVHINPDGTFLVQRAAHEQSR